MVLKGGTGPVRSQGWAKGALCGNTSPASTDFRKLKILDPAFCFWVFPFFNLGCNILDDLNPQGFLGQSVESWAGYSIKAGNRSFSPACLFSSTVAAADQGLAPQLASAGPGFNEMPSHYISWGSGPQCLILSLFGTKSRLAMQEQNSCCCWSHGAGPGEGSHLLEAFMWSSDLAYNYITEGLRSYLPRW